MIILNENEFDNSSYENYHKKRIKFTIDKLNKIGARNIVEVGGHPWVMTSSIIDNPNLDLLATISAEEIIKWPDEIGVTKNKYIIKTVNNNTSSFYNYSANIERTIFNIDEDPDTVLACEIIEHLVRSPHVLLLNINKWLKKGGKLILTTPNGLQFNNPFRRKTQMPSYRCYIYERHSYIFSLEKLIDLTQLCGFEVLSSGLVDVYDRNGLSKLYKLASKIPFDYFSEKFKPMIYVIAQKGKSVVQLERCPKAYDSNGDWEYIN